MILRFQSGWEINKKGENIIEISSPFKKKKYKFKSENPSFFDVINSLSEGIQYPEDLPKFTEKFGIKESTLHSLILKFKTYGIIIEDEKIPSPILETLYDRQIRFFRTFETQTSSGEQINDNLQNKTVLIVGLGGYGSWVALLCARMGIRNIIGIDFDRVEVSNLHRQILYNREDLGTYKIHACEKKIKETDEKINFVGHRLKVTCAEDLYPFLENVDLVFNPFSYIPSTKASDHPSGIIAQAAMIKGKPCLTFGGSWIGPLTIPNKSSCYFCAIKTLELNGNLEPELRNQNIQKRAFAPPIAICCSMAVLEASRFLSGCDDSQVLNGIIQLDVFAFSNSRLLSLQPSPNCRSCNDYETNNFKAAS